MITAGLIILQTGEVFSINLDLQNTKASRRQWLVQISGYFLGPKYNYLFPLSLFLSLYIRVISNSNSITICVATSYN